MTGDGKMLEESDVFHVPSRLRRLEHKSISSSNRHCLPADSITLPPGPFSSFLGVSSAVSLLPLPPPFAPPGGPPSARSLEPERRLQTRRQGRGWDFGEIGGFGGESQATLTQNKDKDNGESSLAFMMWVPTTHLQRVAAVSVALASEIRILHHE